jgi:hypothetical protein
VVCCKAFEAAVACILGSLSGAYLTCLEKSRDLNTDRQEEGRRVPISGPSKYESVMWFHFVSV